MKPSIASSSLFFSISISCAALVLTACDPEQPGELEDIEDSEGIDEDETSAGELAEPLNAEIQALSDDVDPAAVFANWVGGNGGTLVDADCPYAYAAIGLTAAATPDGNLVRQIGLVCALEAEVEAGHTIPAAQQIVISSRYNNSGYQVEAAMNWRPVWDASAANPLPWQRYKAPGASYHLCAPGYRLNKIDVRAGAAIDRIDSYTCWWDGPGGQGPSGLVYSLSVNVGGGGGSLASSSCQGTSEKFVGGIRFRSAAWLDGFQLDCYD